MLMETSQHHSAVAAQSRWSEYGHWVGLASKAQDGEKMLRKRNRQMELIEKMFDAQIQINTHVREELAEMINEINKIEAWINEHESK